MAESSLVELVDLAAAHEHRRTAEDLDSLRERIGRENLLMSEWNALVGAASHLRVEAWRRERRAADCATTTAALP